MKSQQYKILSKVCLCLILFFIGLMSASVTHAEYYSFVTKWGVDIPLDIAVDSLGNVYVTGDYCYIYKFDSNGTLLTKWDTSGCDSTAFDVFPVYNGPRGVAVDSLGNVYASVSENFTRDEHYDLHADINIQKFDSNGKFITKWGSSGSGDGQFNHSQGCCCRLFWQCLCCRLWQQSYSEV